MKSKVVAMRLCLAAISVAIAWNVAGQVVSPGQPPAQPTKPMPPIPQPLLPNRTPPQMVVPAQPGSFVPLHPPQYANPQQPFTNIPPRYANPQQPFTNQPPTYAVPQQPFTNQPQSMFTNHDVM